MPLRDHGQHYGNELLIEYDFEQKPIFDKTKASRLCAQKVPPNRLMGYILHKHIVETIDIISKINNNIRTRRLLKKHWITSHYEH